VGYGYQVLTNSRAAAKIKMMNLKRSKNNTKNQQANKSKNQQLKKLTIITVQQLLQASHHLQKPLRNQKALVNSKKQKKT